MGGTLELADLGHGRGKLALDAARSIFRIDRQIGHPQQITEGYRTPEKANENHRKYQAWLNGTGPWAPIGYPAEMSVHCRGEAIDTNEQRVEILADHGWIRTVYRWVNGVYTLMEPWHFEYDISRDNHRGEHIPLNKGADGVWRYEEEDMDADERKKLDMTHNYAKAVFDAVAISTEERERQDGELTAMIRSNFVTLKRQNENNARRLEAQDAAIASLSALLAAKGGVDRATVEKAVRAEMRAWLDKHSIAVEKD
jgi:hypothetical protein